MDATTIVLPSPPSEPARPPLPILAAVVPVVAGVVLWLITQSLFALCFAALGPLMLLASFFDGMRSRRRSRRRAQDEADAAWLRAESELSRLHEEEQTALWHRSPDAARCLLDPPLRGPGGVSAATVVVIGRGRVRSGVRASGGDDDRSRGFRERAGHLTDAPIVLPLGGGVCVRAAEPVAAAVVRALVVQLCLRFSPAELAVHGDAVVRWGLDALPHARRRRSRFVLRLGDGPDAADAVISIRMPGEEPPEGVTSVLDLVVPSRARIRTPDGLLEAAVEAVSRQQVAVIAAGLESRDDDAELPDGVDLAELEQPPAGAPGLGARFVRGERGDLVLDLVEDGPHAVITGMTGTGKSELLTSWVAAIAATHAPDEVCFVLIDFKGGTAFDPLRALPHVAAVVTDLDAENARRGVGSLTAELRRREAALAQAAARDIAGCPSLARLVIVVDEFAALVREHPDLAQIFTDVAARGRALGMHLVLGTQRAGGVIRDALAANCPLRLSLRVSDAADSRLVIGSDAAAMLPGGPGSRGLVYVRRPEDTEARAMRVALTSADDIAAIAERWADAGAQPSPWLAPLPSTLEIPESAGAGIAVLGLADEPERQRQPLVPLAEGESLGVIGGAGSGKSTVIRSLATQLPDAVVIPADPEDAWDAIAELVTGRHGVVLCDDLDLLTARYPLEHAQLFLSRWETIARDPAGAVVTVSRASGPTGRLLDGLSRRVLLRLSSRVEHIAAGGDSSSFDAQRPAGRAWVDGREVQLCGPADEIPTRFRGAAAPTWRPSRHLAGVITMGVEKARTALASAHPGHRVIALAEAATVQVPPGDGPTIFVGDPEEWRSQWARLQGIRAAGELVVAAECATELRQLAGVREPAPYARPHAGRVWVVEAGAHPRRMLLG